VIGVPVRPETSSPALSQAAYAHRFRPMRASMVAVVAASWAVSNVVRAEPACNGLRLADFAGKQIVMAQDTLFFATDTIQLDIDGAPSAYGARDQGVEDICNGLAPLQPADCRGKIQGRCYSACRAAFASWNGKLQTLGDTMCSIGLGGGGCSDPDVNLQAPPRQDWFVSETTVHVAPPEGTSISAWVRTQTAQLDSTDIPYFVIPGHFRRIPWDATPGDVGVLIYLPSGKQVAFTVGDVGGALDEGSAHLLAELRGVDSLPTVRMTSALGESVQRLEGALDGNFRVAIFRHTAPLLPVQQRGELSVLDKSAGELAQWIRETARERLRAIGGPARLMSCTEPSNP
jgi:hypothetical protein